MAADGMTIQAESDEPLQLRRHEIPLIEGKEGEKAVDKIRDQFYLIDERENALVKAEIYQQMVNEQIEKAWPLLLVFMQSNPEATLDEIVIERDRIMEGAEKPSKLMVEDKIEIYLENQRRFQELMFHENGLLGHKGMQEEQIVDAILSKLLEFTAQNPSASVGEIKDKLIELGTKKKAKGRITLRVAEVWAAMHPPPPEEN